MSVPGFLIVAAVVLALDLSLRPWRGRVVGNAVYLLIPYGALGLTLVSPPWALAVAACGIAAFGFFSFARMVGLVHYRAFFGSALAAIPVFFLVSQIHWYALFQAMPVYAIVFVLFAGSLSRRREAFLQKICLAWLGVLVYGYLWAHAALFLADATNPRLPGNLWLASTVLIAKCSDTAWIAAKRLLRCNAQFYRLIALLGALVGSVALAACAPMALSVVGWIGLGMLMGLALGAGSPSYNLIVQDVVGEDPSRPLKGTMLFAFAFAVALAYHWIRYLR